MKIFSFFLGQWPSSTTIYFVTDEVFTKSGDDLSSPQASRKRTASPSLSPRKKSTADRPSSEQLAQHAGPIDIKDLKIGDQVGTGGTAKVFRGVWMNADVAVKEIETPSSKAAMLVTKVLNGEVQVHATLHHKNILPMFGYATNKNNLLVVTELLDCSLESKLYPSCELTEDNMNFIAKEMCW